MGKNTTEELWLVIAHEWQVWSKVGGKDTGVFPKGAGARGGLTLWVAEPLVDSPRELDFEQWHICGF